MISGVEVSWFLFKKVIKVQATEQTKGKLKRIPVLTLLSLMIDYDFQDLT